MNITELKQSLAFLTVDQNLDIVIYAILKDNQSIKKLDIANDDLPGILKIFTEGIKQQIIDKVDYNVISISNADERRNCFYEYDLEIPAELQLLESLVADDTIPNFNFANDKIDMIESLVVIIVSGEQTLSIYKKISAIEIIGRGSYLIGKSNQRLQKYNGDLLRISQRIDVIRINDTYIIMDINFLEKNFGFRDIIIREATNSLNTIRATNIINNIDVLEDLINDISFARKLTKVARFSPVIALKIPNDQIINFSRTHPAMQNKLRYTEDGQQIVLDTKISKIQFVKMLNDDFLTSDLTALFYESLAKDKLD